LINPIARLFSRASDTGRYSIAFVSKRTPEAT